MNRKIEIGDMFLDTDGDYCMILKNEGDADYLVGYVEHASAIGAFKDKTEKELIRIQSEYMKGALEKGDDECIVEYNINYLERKGVKFIKNINKVTNWREVFQK